MDLRNLRDPLELIKTHFRTEFLKEQYQLSSVLSSEDLEKGEYLKILTLFSSGWKLSVEGYIDPNYECKVVQLSHYYLIRKNNISSAAIVPVELYTHPSSRQELLRVFVMARKVGNCQPTNKLYLRN